MQGQSFIIPNVWSWRKPPNSSSIGRKRALTRECATFWHDIV